MAVNASPESIRARRYLLGEATDDEGAAIEREYFADERGLERIEAAEEDLVEDYLSDRLTSEERSRFERGYLAAPHRRRRVDTMRGLIALAQMSAPAPAARPASPYVWASLAAAALLIVSAGAWWTLRTAPAAPAATDARPSRAPSAPAPSSTPTGPGVTPASPRVFAWAISPLAVRSAGDSPRLVIPAGIDIVRLQLEGGAGDRRPAGARARVRTVAGQEVWVGPAAPTDATPGVIAQIEVPAARLTPNDYLVGLFDVDATGVERERSSYFLPVRAR
jgi:hypothetical protein